VRCWTGLYRCARPGRRRDVAEPAEPIPVTDIFSFIDIAGGRVWMLPKGVAGFAGDLSEAEQKVVWATGLVIDVIRTAANAVQRSTIGA
jgi:hypothetical protein